MNREQAVHIITDQDDIQKVIDHQKHEGFDAPLSVNAGIVFAPVVSGGAAGVIEAYRASLDKPIEYRLLATMEHKTADEFALQFIEVICECCDDHDIDFIKKQEGYVRGFLVTDGKKETAYPLVLKEPLDLSFENERLKFHEIGLFKEQRKKEAQDDKLKDAIGAAAYMLNDDFEEFADVIIDQPKVLALIDQYGIKDFDMAMTEPNKSCMGFIVTPTGIEGRHYMFEGRKNKNDPRLFVAAYALPSSMPLVVRETIFDKIRTNRLDAVGMPHKEEIRCNIDAGEDLLKAMEQAKKQTNKRKE